MIRKRKEYEGVWQCGQCGSLIECVDTTEDRKRDKIEYEGEKKKRKGREGKGRKQRGEKGKERIERQVGKNTNYQSTESEKEKEKSGWRQRRFLFWEN